MADSLKKAESQVDKFREAARELETDEREEAFDKIVKQIARSTNDADRKQNGDKEQ